MPGGSGRRLTAGMSMPAPRRRWLSSGSTPARGSARSRLETLVVIPTLDELVPPAWQYELAASLPNATVVELPGVRHEAPWTHPDRVVEVISSFVG